MGTSATIWKEKSDGTYKGIHVKSDGLLNHTGLLLNNLINEPKKLTELFNVAKEFDTSRIDGIYTSAIYKDKYKYRDFIKMYDNDNQTTIKTLKQSNIQVFLRQKEYANDILNQPLDNISWESFNYYQKLSGKWFVKFTLKCNISGLYYDFEINQPLNVILKLIKMGIISVDGRLNIKKAFTKEALTVIRDTDPIHKDNNEYLLRKLAVELSEKALGYINEDLIEMKTEEILKITSRAVNSGINISMYSDSELAKFLVLKQDELEVFKYKKMLFDEDLLSSRQLNAVKNIGVDKLKNLYDNIVEYNMNIYYRDNKDILKLANMSKQEAFDYYNEKEVRMDLFE